MNLDLFSLLELNSGVNLDPKSRRFVTPPGKEDVHVNQVTLSLEKVRPYEAWPSDDVIVGRVETRSSTRRKEATKESSKKEKRAEARTVKEAKRGLKDQKARKSEPPVTKVREPIAEQEVSERSESNSDGSLVKLLRRKYDADIKEEVSDLLREALRDKSPKTTRRPEADSEVRGAPTGGGGRQEKMEISTVSSHYDIVKDIGA
ncbi:hypothetical protein AXG93_3112s1040 [Marchantia polymorpha subsp. ruderalis]|uniref:Uncharacterized protein n=1 Tax=Marchantia polymorpha subsp. ruderalis TaxID=1480154 RepID=A0A176W7H9_MARPO|nr:hypothetical protein AXG93_3112s1040 [Marchantia polymorpha subsp. ruderalis]